MHTYKKMHQASYIANIPAKRQNAAQTKLSNLSIAQKASGTDPDNIHVYQHSSM